MEINPFKDDGKIKLAEGKREIISDIKKVNIWTELESDLLILKTEFGEGKLQSYSMEGLNLILNDNLLKVRE